MKNPGSTPVPDWLKEGATYPMAAMLNLKEFMKSIYTSAGSPTGETDLDVLKMIEQFGAITMKGGDFSDGSLNSRVEFNIGDGQHNSLEQLFNLINTLASSNFAGRKRENVEELKIESIQQEGVKEVPPPPPPPKKPSEKVKVKQKN